MNRTLKFTLFSLLVMIPLITASQAVRNEFVCVDITYPLNGCDAIELCPDLCKLHSKVWAGQFGTNTNICEDQKKQGNSICECVKE